MQLPPTLSTSQPSDTPPERRVATSVGIVGSGLFVFFVLSAMQLPPMLSTSHPPDTPAKRRTFRRACIVSPLAIFNLYVSWYETKFNANQGFRIIKYL